MGRVDVGGAGGHRLDAALLVPFRVAAASAFLFLVVPLRVALVHGGVEAKHQAEASREPHDDRHCSVPRDSALWRVQQWEQLAGDRLGERQW